MDDRLFFYYTGHGADRLGRVGYMQFAGARDGRFAGNQVLKLKEIHDWMVNLPVRHQLYLLDCCASGLVLNDKGGRDDCQEAVLATLSGIGSRTILTAGTGDQRAYAQSDQFGLFTRAFLDAFEAEPTRGRCAMTTAGDVYAYMQRRMSQFTADQPVTVTPRMWESAAPQHAGSFVFLHDESGARLGNEARVRLQLTDKGKVPLMGRVRIVTFREGRLLVDGVDRGLLPKGGTWQGNLEAGSHTASIELGGEREQKVFSLAPGAYLEISLGLRDLQPLPLPEDQKAPSRESLKKHGVIQSFPIADGVSVEMVWLEGGTFTMGSRDPGASSNEKPREVKLTKGFWLGVTEVSQAQWKAVMGVNPSLFKGGELPVEKVSWNDVQAFIKKING